MTNATDTLTAREMDLTTFDVILVNTSAGKDSQAMMDKVVKMAREQGVIDRVIAVHADLGRVEWMGTDKLAAEQCDAYGIPLHIVRREQGDLLAQIQERYDRLQERAAECHSVSSFDELEGVNQRALLTITNNRLKAEGADAIDTKAKDKMDQLKALHTIEDIRALGDKLATTPHWPSNKTRYCTSDQKRSPIRALINKLTRNILKANGEKPSDRHDNPIRVLNCMGLRAEESTFRENKTPFELNASASSKFRKVYDWLPIHAWDNKMVWDTIEASGVRHHWAYDVGMGRLSCVFCVFATRNALLIAGENNPELLAQYADEERRTGYQFTQAVSLVEIQDALAKGERGIPGINAGCPGL